MVKPENPSWLKQKQEPQKLTNKNKNKIKTHCTPFFKLPFLVFHRTDTRWCDERLKPGVYSTVTMTTSSTSLVVTQYRDNVHFLITVSSSRRESMVSDNLTRSSGLSVGLGVGGVTVVSGSLAHSYSCDGWVCDFSGSFNVVFPTFVFSFKNSSRGTDHTCGCVVNWPDNRRYGPRVVQWDTLGLDRVVTRHIRGFLSCWHHLYL
jgi:hypothetical protein